MAITKNLIHFNEKTKFEEKLANNEILDKSIVFIKDTQEIYTHGQLYKCADPDLSIYLTTTNAGNTYATITTANGLQENIDDVITDLQEYKTTVASTYITPNEVDAKIAALVDSAPTTLDTLNELAAALGDDPNFATTVATNIGNIDAKFNNYLPLTGGRLKGELKINTEAENDNQKFGFFKTDNSNQNNYGCLQIGANVGVEKPIGITLSGCDPTLTANGTDKYSLCVVGLGKGYTTQELKDLTRNSDKTERCRVVVNGNLLMENGKIIGTADAADSVPWTGVTDRPTSLPASDVYAWAKKSSLALEDVPDLSSKYLSLSGGTLSGGLTISAGNFIMKGSDTVLGYTYPTADNTHALGHTDRRWSNVVTVLLNGYTPITSGNIGSQNAGSATKLATARTIWGQSFDGTGDVSGDLNLKTSKLYWHGDSIHYYIGTSYTIVSSASNLDYNAYSGHRFLVRTNEAMRINSSGNVGIGTTDPAYKLDVAGEIKASSVICGTSRLRVNVTGNAGVFGFMDAQLFGTTTNVASVHIGSCYGGSTTLDNTTEYPNGVSKTAISIYRGRVGIGKRWSDTELLALHDANCSLGVSNNAHIMGNLAVSSIYSDNGQSGVAGVVLRNEGGIEISHASTPYIDFHFANSTSDFSHRLVARADNIFAYSGNYFCPWGNESLGASSYRWRYVYAKAGSFSNNMEINGALTVGAGATITGAVTIDGETAATQTWVTSQGYITGITAGTGLTGGGTSGNVTLGLTNTYQTYISNGNTAYSWGNHSGKYLPIEGGTCTGAITATAFYQSSDETLKVFGDDISIDFNALKRIPKKYFNWKDGNGTIEIGTGAQSLQKVYPELVAESNGHLVVAYDKLSIIALKAIDVLHAENQELKNRLTKLEEMVYGNRC